MGAAAWMQAAAFVVLLTALTPPLGSYMARVFRGEATALDRFAGPVERLVHRALATDPHEGQDWKRYAVGDQLQRPLLPHPWPGAPESRHASR